MKKYFKISAITTVIIYLCSSFINLDFTLLWLKEFILESAENRVLFLVLLLVKCLLDVIIHLCDE